MTQPAPDTVEAPIDPAQPPAWLSDDARGYWADLMRHLEFGTIKPADAHAFAMLANELATYAEADEIVQQTGILIDGGAALIQNPALGVRNASAAAVARWSQYLGITPDDRQVHRKAPEQGRLRHRRER